MTYLSETITPRKRRQYYFGAFVLMALAGLGFLFFVLSSPAVLELSPEVPEAVASYEYGEWVPELPVRLVIPSIDIDAEIQYVGLDQNGTGEMEVPSNFTDVGWYEPGIRPGMRGSAVIAGHLNGKEVPEAVFYDLHTLEVGDEVVIMSANRVEDIFHVVRIETYDYDEAATDVFVSSDGVARLNLITCGGKWLPEEKRYDKRTVVFTELLTNVE